jgi:hypothetical protein
MEVEAQAVVVEGDAVPLGEGRVRSPSLLLVRPCLSRVGEQQCQVGVTVGQSKAAQVDEA